MDKREEILDNKPSQKGGNGSKFYNRTVVLKAMSEYAQLESIEFLNWYIDQSPDKFTEADSLQDAYQIFKQEQQTTK